MRALLAILLLAAAMTLVSRADVLVGCVDIYQDIPACMLHLLDANQDGAISYAEWVTGAENIAFGKEVMAQVNATQLFDACDYTGDYQLGMEDWGNRSWPCLIPNTHVLIICYLCQQNGWVPDMVRK